MTIKKIVWPISPSLEKEEIKNIKEYKITLR